MLPNYSDGFTAYALDRLPIAEMTEPWKKALAEFCDLMTGFGEDQVYFTYRAAFTEEYAKRALDDLKAGKETAKLCLLRLKNGGDPVAVKRDQELETMRKRAEELGYRLTKISN